MFRSIVATGFALSLLTGTANAQNGTGTGTGFCGPYSKMIAVVKTVNEKLKFRGITNLKLITEVWAGEKDDELTFSIFIVQQNGRTCVVALGQEWRVQDDQDN